MIYPKKTSLFLKILIANFFIVGMIIALGAFSIYQLTQVGDMAKEMKDNWLPSVRYSLEMRSNLATLRIAELQYILSNTEEDVTQYEKQMNKMLTAYRSSESSYAALITETEERSLYTETQRLMNQYIEIHQKVVKLTRMKENDAALQLMRGESVRLRRAIDDHLRQIVEVNVAGSQRSGVQAEHIYKTARNLILAMLTFASCFGVLLALVISRSLIRQLGGDPTYAAGIASQVATGNLAVDVRLRSGDNTSLLYVMNAMRRTLTEIVRRIDVSAEAVSVASNQIAHGNIELSRRTEEQASSLQETASSMRQLTIGVKKSAENASHANQLALHASAIAGNGGQLVSKVVTAMSDIATDSKKIVDIIGVIESIAFQTNILALNAAVEAARAGEQGRGFAVVASEVRTLAQRSASAAKEIKELIERSVEKVTVGSQLVDRAGSTMENIVHAVKRVTEIVSEISSISADQASGIEHVNEAVAQIDQVTQKNAALVEEAAAAANSLTEQSNVLREAVSAFQLTHNRNGHPQPDSNSGNLYKQVSVTA